MTETAAKAPPARVKKKDGFLRKYCLQRALILMLIPGVFSIFLFNYIPMYGVVIAFQDYNPMEGFFGGNNWVGLKYFIQFFKNPFLWRLTRNTVLLGVYSFLWGFPSSIILALMLDQVSCKWFKKSVQSITYFPYFISMIVIVGMLKSFFAIDGPVNHFRTLFGGTAISFFTEPQYFRSLYIGSGIWQGVGWGSIIYLAALSNVDPQLHEAAIIDGATRMQRIRYVSWPSILPTVTIMMLMSIGGILGSDSQKVLLMYSSPIYETADIVGTYVYREGILGGKFEYSTAVGLLTNVLSFLLLVIANTISKKLNETSLW